MANLSNFFNPFLLSAAFPCFVRNQSQFFISSIPLRRMCNYPTNLFVGIYKYGDFAMKSTNSAFLVGVRISLLFRDMEGTVKSFLGGTHKLPEANGNLLLRLTDL